MAQKFLIINDALITGTVEFHKELVREGTKREDIKGGGWYHWDEEEKVVLFYSTSQDYGSVTIEEWLEALKSEDTWISPFWDDHKFIFSDRLKLEDVYKQNGMLTLMQKIMRETQNENE